jgi:hypothetical protein
LINLLTPVEPTDWGGGTGLNDAFVEVSPVSSAIEAVEPM